ncbi:MAG: phosphatidylglycerol lysyltransferase domain-containing protein [Treponema sp.]|nr:phosphatidylglycerol lysyltransferase domain-containing protein [Treponema sp.]
MTIPFYPEFTSLTLELKDAVNENLLRAPDGVSEFSFAGLYLFRERYGYRISKTKDEALILSGVQPAKEPGLPARSFFMTPSAPVDKGVLDELFSTHDFWKDISDSILAQYSEHIKDPGIEISEDRDNFDYLYLRSELAELPGKKFHKKRNLVAQFNSEYVCTSKPISAETSADALAVLEGWEADREKPADYVPATEALKLHAELGLTGSVYYIENRPAAWCLGENSVQRKMFTIHFEKALEEYKGIYQYINQAFAASLPADIVYLNREQDLGDEGLRQAKLSYRPCGFVRKFTGTKK